MSHSWWWGCWFSDGGGNAKVRGGGGADGMGSKDHNSPTQLITRWQYIV
jgi:hypothetical protein